MKVAIIMGSRSDYPQMKEAETILLEYGVEVEVAVVSAHRTPEYMVSFAKTAREKGFDLIIAGAGGAAHLPGMVASLTTLPVIGVPMKSSILNGVDSLLSIVQMPAGVPVGTMSIGAAGARNAALYALRILSLSHPALADTLERVRLSTAQDVIRTGLGEEA
ncbi:MAG: 5-(carboxyamino)imidazole ribonucleotide mutase [Sphaerochaetaceae bacterium]|nr:5-(carboxyamino)imidazole ribonucleotide mutase [Sphaerochaetaceae bacterium]